MKMGHVLSNFFTICKAAKQLWDQANCFALKEPIAVFPCTIEGGGGKYFPCENLISCVICVPESSWSLGPLNKATCLMVHWFEIVLCLFSCGHPLCRDGLCELLILEDPASFKKCWLVTSLHDGLCYLSGFLMCCSSSDLVFVQKCFIRCVCCLPGSSVFLRRSSTGCVCYIPRGLFSFGKTKVNLYCNQDWAVLL